MGLLPKKKPFWPFIAALLSGAFWLFHVEMSFRRAAFAGMFPGDENPSLNQCHGFLAGPPIRFQYALDAINFERFVRSHRFLNQFRNLKEIHLPLEK